MGDQDKSSVVLTSASNSERAEVICAVLRSHGFDAYVMDANLTSLCWHLTLAINPAGIRIAVPAGQAEEAWQALEDLEKESAENRVPRPQGVEPDGRDFVHPELAVGSVGYYAILASRSALLSLLFMPLAFLAAYYLVKAARAARRGTPRGPRCAFHVWTALCVVVFWIALFCVVGWAISSHSQTSFHPGDTFKVRHAI